MSASELFQTTIEKLATLPPTENPYLFAGQMLERIVYPQLHPVVFGFLIFFAIIHATIIICCISVIIIPFRSGREGRRKNLWLYHRRYVAQFETPYYLPNSSMGVAITQLITSILFITFIFLAYHSHHSPKFQRSCFLLIWYGFCYLPGYIGLYITAWNACLTCLTSRGRDGRAQALCRYLPPRLLNILLLIIPVGVTIYSIVVCIRVGSSITNFNLAYETLQNNLALASRAWSHHHGEANLGILLIDSQNLSKVVADLTVSCRYAAGGWTFWVAVLLLCYAIAVSSLLRLLKQCVAASASTGSSDFNTRLGKNALASPLRLGKNALASPLGVEGPRVVAENETVLHWTFVPAGQTSELKLKKCFDYMVRHCSFMFMAILYDLAVTIVLHRASYHITEPGWRSVSLLVSLLGAMLVSPAMIFQAWRTFTERDPSPAPISSHQTSQEDLPSNPSPKLPSSKTEQQTTKSTKASNPKPKSPLRLSERLSRAFLGDPKSLLPPAKQICVEQVTTQWTENPDGINDEIEEIQIVLHSSHKTISSNSEP